jgi:hypothetical protein
LSWAPLTVVVPGFAATLTAPKAIAEPWKIAVADAVGRHRTEGPLQEPVRVELLFGIPETRFRDTAVFNLLKSTIDGLSAALFHPSPSGQPGPWSREDWWITELVAEKVVANGAAARITFADPLVAAIVPGEPPLWPGDAAGQVRVLDWRQRAAVICGTAHIRPEGPVEAHLEFVIGETRMRTSDLDNFCVPAGQALAAIAFGDSRSGTRIARMVASKRVAVGAELPHTRLEVFAI